MQRPLLVTCLTERLMKAFQDGSRPATVMHQHAKAYSDDEIEQMAAIFAAVKP